MDDRITSSVGNVSAGAGCCGDSSISTSSRPMPVDEAATVVSGGQQKSAPRMASKPTTFDVMEELGTNLLLVCSSVSPTALDDDRIAE